MEQEREIKMSFEIIDFHTHPFLTAEENLNGYIKSNMDSMTILEDMDNAGVSRFCGSVIIPKNTDFESLKKSNRDALILRDRYKGRYIPGFHVSPNYIEESIAEIKYAYDNGINLIGELVPYMHGWSDYSCNEFSVLLDEIEKYNMTVSLHTIDLDQMEKMAASHKNINFVFAHPGEKNQVLRHVEIMKKYDNVYLDLSGTGIFRWGLVEFLVNEVGAERILFGSDYPICGVGHYAAGVHEAKISDNAKELIFSGNTKRLFKI